jgi:DNA-binding winged helix-turn-helix (wHTH) protein
VGEIIAAAGATRVSAEPTFQVGDWRVEPTLNQLTLGERRVQIEPKIMSVLVALARNHGRLTPRSEILEEVWEGAHLAEDPMPRAVSELRRVFGDSAREPRFIETIHGKGYRLIAPVRRGDEPATPTGGEASARRWRLPMLLIGAVAIAALGVTATSRLALAPAPLPGPPRQAQLTSTPGREVHPALSPDGSRVAFARSEAGSSDLDIFVQGVSSSEPVRLTTSPTWDMWPRWSPDGSEIAFVRLGREPRRPLPRRR